MPQDVRIVGWDEQVGDALELAFAAGMAFGAVVVILLTAAALTLLFRSGR